MQKKLDPQIKKNLLDLSYNKYLQYYTTTIIAGLTYFIGLAIAFLTGGIPYKQNPLILVGVVSAAVLGVVVLLIRSFQDHMENIKEEVRKLKFKAK